MDDPEDAWGFPPFRAVLTLRRWVVVVGGALKRGSALGGGACNEVRIALWRIAS